MARRHARPAHDDPRLRFVDTQHAKPKRHQLFPRLPGAVVVDTQAQRQVCRARNMSCHRINRFQLAIKSLYVAGVDQAEFADPVAGFDQFLCLDDQLLSRLHPARCVRCCFPVGTCREALPQPLRESSVEQSNSSMAGPAEQPPRPRGYGAVIGVVNDHVRVPVDTELPQKVLELGHTRKRMSARLRADWCRQITVQVCENCSWNMALEIVSVSGVYICEIEATIHHAPRRVVQVLIELAGANQVAMLCHPLGQSNCSSGPCTRETARRQ